MELKNTTEHEFPWLTTNEVGQRKGCSGDNIQKLLRAKRMPHVKVGAPGPGRSLFLIHVDDIESTQSQPLVEDSNETENRSGREFPWRSTVWLAKEKGLVGETIQKVLNRDELPYVKIGSPGKGRALFLIHLQDLEHWWPKWTEGQSPMSPRTKPGKNGRGDRPVLSLPRLSSADCALLANPLSESPEESEIEFVEGEFVDIP